MNVVLLATGRLTVAGLETVRADLGGDPALELDVIGWRPPREPLGETCRYVLVGPGRMPSGTPRPAEAPPRHLTQQQPDTHTTQAHARRLTEQQPETQPVQAHARRLTEQQPEAQSVQARARRLRGKRGVAAVRWRYRRVRRWTGRLFRSRRSRNLSRAYWSAIRSRTDVLAVIDRADVVIAMDNLAIRAGWQVAHRRAVDVPVLFGVAAARRELGVRS